MHTPEIEDNKYGGLIFHKSGNDIPWVKQHFFFFEQWQVDASIAIYNKNKSKNKNHDT